MLRKERTSSIKEIKGAFTSVSNIHQKIDNLKLSKANSIIISLTIDLVETYSKVDNKFHYDKKYNPKRIFTSPSEAVLNCGYDNENHDYILRVNEYIGNNISPNKYKIVEFLGKGTFGQVVKCLNTETGDYVAVKVIKNHPSYYNQGLVEARTLKELINTFDPDSYNIVHFYESFIFRNHLCIVFELLNVNLYELIKLNKFRGFTPKLVSLFAKQILTCLTALYHLRIIHCDLKPENILLEPLSNHKGPKVKVIDFGSACYEQSPVFSYIQSRFYRSPEVILGHQYKLPIDIWSLGCIVFELFVGFPLFPGQNQHRMLARFIRFLGFPPYRLLKEGKDTLKFFHQVSNTGTSDDYVLMTDEEYYRHNKLKGEIPEFKEFFKGDTIDEIIMDVSYKKVNSSQREEEYNIRKSMVHFIKQTVRWDPDERWTPHELLEHPFITGKKFTGDIQRPRSINQFKNYPNAQYKSYNWPFVGTPTEQYIQNGGFISPLGTSPSSQYYGSPYYSNQQNYYRNYGYHPSMYYY